MLNAKVKAHNVRAKRANILQPETVESRTPRTPVPKVPFTEMGGVRASHDEEEKSSEEMYMALRKRYSKRKDELKYRADSQSISQDKKSPFLGGPKRSVISQLITKKKSP